MRRTLLALVLRTLEENRTVHCRQGEGGAAAAGAGEFNAKSLLSQTLPFFFIRSGSRCCVLKIHKAKSDAGLVVREQSEVNKGALTCPQNNDSKRGERDGS